MAGLSVRLGCETWVALLTKKGTINNWITDKLNRIQGNIFCYSVYHI